MSEDDMFFAGAAPEGDAPIVLGPPSDDPFGAADNYGDYAAAPPDYGDFGAAEGESPTYLGDVNEAPPADDRQPIVLGTSGSIEETTLAVPESNEPTPMQIWNNEWQETLKVRKDEENARKAELIEEARIALEAFQVEREQKREAAMAKNREDEQVKLEAIEADLENDNSWQRVCKMVELQHESTEKSQDVKRMRDIMILLKNEPTKAQALTN
jgi:Clathrin light chain